MAKKGGTTEAHLINAHTPRGRSPRMPFACCPAAGCRQKGTLTADPDTPNTTVLPSYRPLTPFPTAYHFGAHPDHPALSALVNATHNYLLNSRTRDRKMLFTQWSAFYGRHWIAELVGLLS